MERAIGIIKREIEKRKSMLLNDEYFLRTKQIKCEIDSLNEVLNLVNKNDLLPSVSNKELAVCRLNRLTMSCELFFNLRGGCKNCTNYF